MSSLSLANRFNGLKLEEVNDDDIPPEERPAMPPVVVVVPDETGAKGLHIHGISSLHFERRPEGRTRFLEEIPRDE